MPMKMDTMKNIKAFMTTQEKSSGKTKSVEHKNNSSKQININTNMIKEASPTESKQKHKAIKNRKDNKSSLESVQTPISAKHDSSVRSPLDGNSKKKQCDSIDMNACTENIKK